jgi:hypothetical protein
MLFIADGSGLGFCEKAREQLRKTLRMFDLHPVSATAEDMQLRAIDPFEQGEGIRQWDHLVVAAVNDERLMRQAADFGFAAGHRIDPDEVIWGWLTDAMRLGLASPERLSIRMISTIGMVTPRRDAAASLSGLALCTTATASFANSELQPGITTGIPLGAPLPPGVFLVDLPNYGYRDATPGQSVGAMVPAWIIWSTPCRRTSRRGLSSGVRQGGGCPATAVGLRAKDRLFR